jgi:ATP-dependent DNA helicase RecG
VEILGTGIVRINEAYKNSSKKPVFEIYENSISVILPVISNLDLTKDEAIVYGVLSKTLPKSISEILVSVPFSKSKTTMLLKRLSEKKIVTITGNGRGTKYRSN